MKSIANILIALVALEHVYIGWLEMFAWTTAGRKAFRSMPSELFEKTKSLAANQGLYNGFLSAGLIWSFMIHDPVQSAQVANFFLTCIVIAGVFGALTVQKSIFVIQAVPAILALMFKLLA
jgi:putative membrane protein